MEPVNLSNLESNTKIFYYAGKIIEHKQIIEVTQCPFTVEPKIENFFSTCDEQKLIKVTQVRIQDQFMKITDIFDIRQEAQSMSKQSQQLHNSSTIQSESSTSNTVDRKSNKINLDPYRLHFPNKKTKKNAIKNLIRIFIFWLRQNTYNTQIIQTIKAMIDKYKYNTRLIYELFNNQTIRSYFIRFGSSDAQEYIKTSKIMDKDIHIRILKQYLSLLINLQGNLLITNGEVSIIQDKQLQKEQDYNLYTLNIV